MLPRTNVRPYLNQHAAVQHAPLPHSRLINAPHYVSNGRTHISPTRHQTIQLRQPYNFNNLITGSPQRTRTPIVIERLNIQQSKTWKQIEKLLSKPVYTPQDAYAGRFYINENNQITRPRVQSHHMQYKPFMKTYFQYEPRQIVTVQMVPVERQITEHYAVQHITDYVLKERQDIHINYLKQQKTNTKVQYLPIQHKFCYVPQQPLRTQNRAIFRKSVPANVNVIQGQYKIIDSKKSINNSRTISQQNIKPIEVKKQSDRNIKKNYDDEEEDYQPNFILN